MRNLISRTLLCVLLLVTWSCGTDYGKKYGYRRHLFDYENAVQLYGEKGTIPQIEFLVFVNGFDTVAIKLKGKKPIHVPIYSTNMRKNTGEIITCYESEDYYNDFSFFLHMSKENVIYRWHMDSLVNTVKGDELFVFEIDENTYVYPYNEEKRSRERENYRKRVEKERKENSYFD